MRRICCAVLLALSGTVFLDLQYPGAQELPPQLVARTEPRSPAEEQKAFHLPPGFEAQLVAAEPAIRKPLNLAFDDRGRIWVTDTIEYPFPAPPDRKGRDSVKVLEDTDGDGVADKVTTFADGLNIPIGIMPIKDGCIVFSIPNIYRMLDTDGDGVADKRDVLYSTFGFQDTHGMASSFNWGFDGYLYACHGFANTSTVQGSDTVAVRMQSGNTYRVRPDGSHIDQWTWGQVNPFGMCFDALGNMYTADCHSKPAYQLLRGAYYPSFGKPHDGLGFGPQLMTHDHGSTAICGIVNYAADHFPPEYRNTLFIGNVVTNRINHDRLERHGSTYKAIQQPDFLKSDDPWFRPVDLKLGPDGALYVADFYNRIIGHYEVPLTHPGRDRERGRIWRIIYKGPDGKQKPSVPRADWSKASIAELVEDLGHANLVVRVKASNQLVERGGPAAVAAVRKVMQPDGKPLQRAHGLWVLQRLSALDDATLNATATDKEPAVRVHAMRVLADHKDLPEPLRKLAVAGLKDADAFVQRSAAEALAVHPNPENLRPLLDLRQAVPADDTHLLHMVRMALRDQLRPAPNWAKLPAVSLSDADARAVADVAPGVPSAESAAFLLEHLRKRPEQGNLLIRYVHHVARYGAGDSVPALLAFAQGNRADDLRHQAALFKAIQQGTQERGAGLNDAARQWAEGLAGKLLVAKAPDAVLAGIELAGSLKVTAAQDTIAALATRKGAPENQRLAAISALAGIDAGKYVPLIGRLLSDGTEPFPIHERAAGTLAGLNSPEARDELVKHLASTPARLQTVLAFGLASSAQGAEKLLEAVASGKASARLLQERIVQVRLEQAKVPDLKQRLAKLTLGLPPADQRLQDLIKQRRTGFAKVQHDQALGVKVFEKQCAICHQVAGKGTKIGPQLDGIGVRGLDRLLEDLLDPNRNVDQAFRSTTLVLKNGQLVAGLVLREEGEVVIVADPQGKEVRVPKNNIDERNVSQLSAMPANVADQVPEADFYHLLAYLLMQRQTK